MLIVKSNHFRYILFCKSANAYRCRSTLCVQNASRWQSKTNLVSAVSSLQKRRRELCVWSWHCVRETDSLWWGFLEDKLRHHFNNKHWASLHHPPCASCVFDFIPSSKMLGGGDDINDQITFRRLHSNVSSSPEYESTLPIPPHPPPCLLPTPPPPSPRPPSLPPPPLLLASALLVSYAFQH